MNINEAANEWVKEFNAIPQDMIATLMEHDIDSWSEVTTIAAGDRVYYCDEMCCGEVLKYDPETEMCDVMLDNGKKISTTRYELERATYDLLPMWGTMWSFGDSCDDWWLSNGNGIDMMSACGFRIYEHDEWGYFFGIDGAGYDFYEAHWIPLYKARGLRWHDEE